MSVWEKEPIQFFWHQEEPIKLYILGNKVVRYMYQYGSHGHFNPVVSFNMLRRLYTHPTTRKQLPKELQTVFEGMEPYPVVDDMYQHFVGINDPHMPTSYLDLEMDIREGKERPILFHDIKYRDEPLKVTIELSVQDAFYILANVCASTRIAWLKKTLKHWFEPCFHQLIKKKDPEYILSLYHNRYPEGKMFVNKEWQKTLIGGVNLHEKYHTETVNKFLIKYLIHLNQGLLKKELSPYKVLRLSGTKPLAFLLSDEEPYIKFIQEFFEKLTEVTEASDVKKLISFAFMEVARYELGEDETCTEIEPIFTALYREKSAARKKIFNDTKSYLPLMIRKLFE